MKSLPILSLLVTATSASMASDFANGHPSITTNDQAGLRGGSNNERDLKGHKGQKEHHGPRPGNSEPPNGRNADYSRQRNEPQAAEPQASVETPVSTPVRRQHRGKNMEGAKAKMSPMKKSEKTPKEHSSPKGSRWAHPPAAEGAMPISEEERERNEDAAIEAYEESEKSSAEPAGRMTPAKKQQGKKHKGTPPSDNVQRGAPPAPAPDGESNANQAPPESEVYDHHAGRGKKNHKSKMKPKKAAMKTKGRDNNEGDDATAAVESPRFAAPKGTKGKQAHKGKKGEQDNELSMTYITEDGARNGNNWDPTPAPVPAPAPVVATQLTPAVPETDEPTTFNPTPSPVTPGPSTAWPTTDAPTDESTALAPVVPVVATSYPTSYPPTESPSFFPTFATEDIEPSLPTCPPVYDSARTDYVAGELAEVTNHIFECHSLYAPYCNIPDWDDALLNDNPNAKDMWGAAWTHMGPCEVGSGETLDVIMAGGGGDEWESYEMAEGSLLKYKVNGDSVSMEVIHDEGTWLGVAFSRNGGMVDSEAVIGLPGDNTVQKYDLMGKTSEGIIPMSSQTLTETSIKVNGRGQTIMKFTKLLVEDSEIEIMAGGSEKNIILFAHGTDGDDTLGYHGGNRMTFELTL